MLKRELFKNAMQSGLYGKLAWLISAFSLSTEEDHAWKADPYPYRIVSNITGHYYVDSNGAELVRIEDADAAMPIYCFTDEVTLEPVDIPNVAATTQTTYGNWFFNWLVLVRAFGTKYPYMDGDITPSMIETNLLKNFRDDPKDPKDKLPDAFYVSEYLVYVEGLYFLTGISQLCVWSATRKTLLPPPGVKELKAKLIKENAGHLNDLATISKIDAALVKHDAEWLKGDPGLNFLIEGKSLKTVRKKKFLMNGGEVGLSESVVSGTLIANSLLEGIDVNNFPVLNDVHRAGSFNRGAQTQLGGVSVKWLLRASANMAVTVDDCGSTVGSPFTVVPGTQKRIIGFTLLTDAGTVHIDDEAQAGTYLGKVVYIRSPMYCKLGHTDFCKVCLGDRLAINPEGLSLAVASYGNQMLQSFLAAAHGRAISTAKMDFMKHIF